ncbi:MAG: hypothetical protein ACP5D2_03880 [Candidatus Nanoarchaeia archaeon]
MITIEITAWNMIAFIIVMANIFIALFIYTLYNWKKQEEEFKKELEKQRKKATTK